MGWVGGGWPPVQRFGIWIFWTSLDLGSELGTCWDRGWGLGLELDTLAVHLVSQNLVLGLGSVLGGPGLEVAFKYLIQLK